MGGAIGCGVNSPSVGTSFSGLEVLLLLFLEDCFRVFDDGLEESLVVVREGIGEIGDLCRVGCFHIYNELEGGWKCSRGREYAGNRG
jgi:hypothetical protein